MGLPQPGATPPQNAARSAAQACLSTLRAASTCGVGAGLGMEAGRLQACGETCAAAGSAMDKKTAAQMKHARMTSPVCTVDTLE
jgi:hypothetical protein